MKNPECLFVEMEKWEAGRLKNTFDECSAIETSADLLRDVLHGQYMRGCEVISPFIYSRVNEETLDLLPDLKLVSTRSTGVDHIDMEACSRRGVAVCNVPTYGANTVAEHTFGLILSLTRRVHKAYEQTTRGRFNIRGLRGIDLRDRTIGVIGTGSIGTHVIRIALGFQMRVLAFDVSPVHHMADALGFRYVDMDTLLEESDIVTLHAPYNDKTHHMIDEEAIKKMKHGSILINTARGALVDTDALVSGLKSGTPGGAGLDVLENEKAIMEEGEILSRHYDDEALMTLVQNNILLRMKNVIITPHIAFNSSEALDKILNTTIENIRGFRGGRPQNMV